MTEHDIIRLASKKAEEEYPNYVLGKEIIIEVFPIIHGEEQSKKLKFVGKPWEKKDERRYDNWTFVEFVK
ncbi:hypothetical protein [Dyadobacter sp. 32]|uniref:hypothetical protein n=1 Tax=Dyadobacter sp. 32 TaxID=538966 RepID=UPI0011EF73BF